MARLYYAVTLLGQARQAIVFRGLSMAAQPAAGG